MGRADLIADGGAAASGDEFFRSPQFLAAEGATHTLRIESDGFSARVPLIVREVEGSEGVDAVSPYGYPGGSVSAHGAPAAETVDWSATGLVSIFGRERVLGEPWLAGARERSALQVHDPARPRAVRGRLAEQIRANERGGWSVEISPGPTAGAEPRDAFAAAYAQTMTRTGAADRYFFGRDYLDAVLSFESSWLLVACDDDGAAGAAAIAARSDGVLHYYLGGTGDAALDASPFKNVVAAMLDLADECGLPLNLGGGVTPGDGLERFKRGFANAEVPFRAHQVVCDPEEYDRLSGERDAGDFFPAYRAP